VQTVQIEGLYETIHRRRDVRAEFTGAAIDSGVLDRVLGAAHAAPSVGLTQPWDFVVIDDPAVRRSFWEHVQRERQVFSARLDDERRRTFETIKIDGVLESSLSVAVTYDPDRGTPAILGGHAIGDVGLYSVCLAIENLWLAATAEGWGVGWVSFYREPFVQQLLGLPERIRAVAWLCLGPVSRLQAVPDLERQDWRHRRPLTSAVHHNRWGATATPAT
jgi:5,6-dimethylbenzimidazole synthase